MKKMKNQRGLTLVEILASVVIAALLLTMIYSIIIGTKEQQLSQTQSNAQLTDISYALKVITKDIRKEGKEPIIKGNEIKINTIKLTYENGVIKRNDEVLVENISNFILNTDDPQYVSPKEYYIIIENETKSVKTILTLRGK